MILLGNYKSLLPERTTKRFNLNGWLLQKENGVGGGGGKIGEGAFGLMFNMHWVSVVMRGSIQWDPSLLCNVIRSNCYCRGKSHEIKNILSFFVFVYFCKKQEWIKKKKSAKTLLCSLASFYP